MFSEDEVSVYSPPSDLIDRYYKVISERDNWIYYQANWHQEEYYVNQIEADLNRIR